MFIAIGVGKVEILYAILDTPKLGLSTACVWLVAPGYLVWYVVVGDVASAEVKLAKSEFEL